LPLFPLSNEVIVPPAPIVITFEELVRTVDVPVKYPPAPPPPPVIFVEGLPPPAPPPATTK
jgi:hypothetical protein